MKREPFQLESSYAYQAYLLARSLRKDFFAICKRADLSLFPEQWFSLYFIVNNPGQSQSELAALAFEDRPSLSRTLQSMIKKGLVAQRKDENDRRSTRYVATEQGEQIYDSMVQAMKQERKRVYGGLSEQDFADFQRIVKILRRNMG
ncbi:MAG: MarR family winged helix-turn-helix transcriptional regulator [Arenicella sp.]